MFNYSASTIKGSTRKVNEDRIMINKQLLTGGTVQGKTQDSIIAVVCDGVGGESGSDVAAEIAAGYYSNIEINYLSALDVSRTVNKVNRIIIKEQKKASKYYNMATTLAGIIIADNYYYIFGAGDTQRYRVCGNTLSVYNFNRAYYVRNSQENTLVRYLGGDGNACFPTVYRGYDFDRHSCYLICSDGIYRNIDDSEIKGILESSISTENKEKAILQLALQHGSTDDMSIVVLEKTEIETIPLKVH